MRSRLFVPGSRPELFQKALASGADVICLDLQDAVAPDKKGMARETVASFLRSIAGPRSGPKIMVRINPLGSEHITADLAAIVTPGLDLINLPMVETALDVRRVCTMLDRLEAQRGLPRAKMLVNIELPRSVRMAGEIAAADTRIMGLQAGYGDLFEPSGILRTSTAAINTVRMLVRLAAAECDLPAFDGAFTVVAKPDLFRAEALAARELGYSGKTCIHPTQVAIANEVFTPSADEIAWARKVVEAGEKALGAGVGAVLVDGHMIDAPFIESARNLLARAN